MNEDINLDLNQDEGPFHKFFHFGGGEGHVTIKGAIHQYKFAKRVNLLVRYRTDATMIRILMFAAALRQIDRHMKINLYLPYFPGARQDRVCNFGEALSVKVYADLINSQNFESVHIFDPHSDVTPALVNNVVVHKNHTFVSTTIRNLSCVFNNTVLVAPDSGANKKIYDLAKFMGGMDVIRADKLRNVATGEIIETIVYADDLSGKICIIPDDICSRGGTFKALAVKLKEKSAAKVVLVASHWEGTADLSSMKASGIDAIYCTTGLAEIPSDDYIKQYDVFSFML